MSQDRGSELARGALGPRHGSRPARGDALLSTSNPIPAAPIITVSRTAITLSWPARALAGWSLIIEREQPTTPASFAEVGRVTVPAGETGIVPWTDRGLMSGTSYTYRIRTVAPGVASPETLVRAVTLPAPCRPRDVACERTSDRWGSVRLTWAGDALADHGYRIERGVDVGGSVEFAEVGSVWAGVSAFNDTSAELGIAYHYRIVAFISSGESAPSDVVTVKPDR